MAPVVSMLGTLAVLGLAAAPAAAADGPGSAGTTRITVGSFPRPSVLQAAGDRADSAALARIAVEGLPKTAVSWAAQEPRPAAPMAETLANEPVSAPARQARNELKGLYYFRARYYDPYAGRFLQRDPVWDAGNVGNQYTFVANNPVNRLDPLGLYSWEEFKSDALDFTIGVATVAAEPLYIVVDIGGGGSGAGGRPGGYVSMSFQATEARMSQGQSKAVAGAKIGGEIFITANPITGPLVGAAVLGEGLGEGDAEKAGQGAGILAMSALPGAKAEPRAGAPRGGARGGAEAPRSAEPCPPKPKPAPTELVAEGSWYGDPSGMQMRAGIYDPATGKMYVGPMQGHPQAAARAGMGTGEGMYGLNVYKTPGGKIGFDFGTPSRPGPRGATPAEAAAAQQAAKTGLETLFGQEVTPGGVPK